MSKDQEQGQEQEKKPVGATTTQDAPGLTPAKPAEPGKPAQTPPAKPKQ